MIATKTVLKSPNETESKINVGAFMEIAYSMLG